MCGDANGGLKRMPDPLVLGLQASVEAKSSKSFARTSPPDY